MGRCWLTVIPLPCSQERWGLPFPFCINYPMFRLGLVFRAELHQTNTSSRREANVFVYEDRCHRCQPRWRERVSGSVALRAHTRGVRVLLCSSEPQVRRGASGSVCLQLIPVKGCKRVRLGGQGLAGELTLIRHKKKKRKNRKKCQVYD